MRKLGRMVRRVLTAVSLLLFVAVLAAWVRGYSKWEWIDIRRHVVNDDGFLLKELSVQWSAGYIEASWKGIFADKSQAQSLEIPAGPKWEVDPGSMSRQSYFYAVARYRAAANRIQLLQFRIPNQDVEMDCYRSISLISVPCWMAAIVFGALPFWRGFVWRRGVRRRRLASREGRCPVCGYDLRASPQRCPECGTAVGARETPGGGAV